MALILPAFVGADEKKSEETKDPGLVFSEDFEKMETGDVPSHYFVIEGDWSVVEIDGTKAMKLAEAPIVEAQVQLGDSLKDSGGTVLARIKADKKRRGYPRFGVGLHGMSGYRLRLFPAQGEIQLVRSDEVIKSAKVDWVAGEWWFIELTAKPVGDHWEVQGRTWQDGKDRPETPQIAFESEEEENFSGKASVTGTAYAGLPIYFDNIQIRRIEGDVAESGKEKPKE
ncbi:MAG: hypothetical protein KDN19_05845 [Verrucomicrobiae bacterium]|nr:hypothetical protein [Verrucomicrobiae bacterium]